MVCLQAIGSLINAVKSFYVLLNQGAQKASALRMDEMNVQNKKDIHNYRGNFFVSPLLQRLLIVS
jgi:hypothetical protein